MRTCEFGVAFDSVLRVDITFDGHVSNSFVCDLEEFIKSPVIHITDDLSVEVVYDARTDTPCFIVGVTANVCDRVVVKSKSDFGFRLILGTSKDESNYDLVCGTLVNAGAEEITCIEL